MRAWWFAALCAWCCWGGEAWGQGAAQGGELGGVVFDAQSHAPLEGVEVEVGGWSGRSDARGYFGATLPAGPWALKVRRAPGPAHELAVWVEAGGSTEVLVELSAQGERVWWEVEGAGPQGQAKEGQEGPEEAPREPVLGSLEGVVSHQETGRPLEGARVLVRGWKGSAVSDASGRFSAQVPAGRWEVSVLHPSFETQSLSQVEVPPAGVVEVKVALSPQGLELGELRVSTPRIVGSALESLSQERQSSRVQEVLGADQISRAGDSDAAGALKRATGVTVLGGRYVYVRGLGDRYSATLLDGATVPSPEPERRVVPLDLFPASLLEGISVQKSWSPDLPGEFGGGSVSLKTRGAPSEPVRSASASLGWRVGTSLREGLRGPSGPWDWSGFDGGWRALPEEVERASGGEALLESDRFSSRGYSPEALERLGEQMSRRWSPALATIPPDLGLSLTLGDRGEAWGAKAGWLWSSRYDQSWLRDLHTERIYTLSGESLELAHRYDFEALTREVGLSSMFVGGLAWEGHELRLTGLLNRSTEDEARVYEGPNRDANTELRATRLRWVERTLAQQVARGDHKLGEHELSWHYSYALALRGEPDRRETRYDAEVPSGVWFLSDRPEGNQRVFSDLVDHNHDAQVSWAAPWEGLGLSWRGSAGARWGWKEREVDTRRYKFQHKGPRSNDFEVLRQRPEDIFTPENIGADGFQLEEFTRQSDNYSASQRLWAGWWELGAAVWEGVDVRGGVRAEHALIEVQTFELFNPDAAPVLARLEGLDWLPSLGATWDVSESHKVRAALARTLSKPEFRELSPSTFNDVTGGREYAGNPDLERASIWHGDVRWEWYPREGDSLSLGVFTKEFSRPVEITVIPSAQLSIQPQNARSASNVGVELEFAQGLDLLTEALRDWSVSGNATWVYSRVELAEGGIQTSQRRPLQGQAPWVLNLQGSWDDPDRGSSASGLLHWSGAYVAEVGALGAPDVYEAPGPQLDFVAKQRMGPLGWGSWSLSFKVSNLLNSPNRLLQGEELLEEVRRGQSVSLGVEGSL